MAKTRYRKVNASVTVYPEGPDGFEACVGIGSVDTPAGGRKLKRRLLSCAIGRNPRDAVANALERVAANIRARDGRYKGSR